MKSSWKFAAIEPAFYRQKFLLRLERLNAMKIWLKGTRVFSFLLEKNIGIYNGMKFVEVHLRRDLVGNFLGQYVLTKRITADIHGKSKKNRKGRKKKKK